MNRGAYASARRAGTETEGVECPTCHAWQPPEAVRRAADGSLLKRCRACENKRNAERMRARRAARKPVMMALPEGHKRCCGCVEVKPHAEFYTRKVGSEAGSLTSHCRACVLARTRARWAMRKAKMAAVRSGSIDWDNPPDHMPCRGCGKTFPIETYDRNGSLSPNGSVVRRRSCRACRNHDQNERNRRDIPSTRQQINDARAVAAGVFVVRPTSHTSALAEGNIAAALYAQALRALATSPPVPVWEREEWA